MSRSRWADVDWSKSTSAIAAERGVAICTVSKARRRHAPETLGAYSTRAATEPVVELQKRLKAATARADDLARELEQSRKQLAIARRAFESARALLTPVLEERDAALATLAAAAQPKPPARARADRLTQPHPKAPAPTPTPTTPTKRPWTPDELRILRATYPEGGAAAAAEALEAAGSEPRSHHTIRQRARRLGVTTQPEHAQDHESERDRILNLLNDYRGLPLHQDDFVDELPIPRDRVRAHLEHLTSTGRIVKKPDPSFTGRGRAAELYFPQEANA